VSSSSRKVMSGCMRASCDRVPAMNSKKNRHRSNSS
jgi:hypothetical protein